MKMLLGALGVVGLGLSAGCGADVDPPPLAFVVANEAMFAAPDSAEVAAVEPGTPMDTLSGLTGCWGDAELNLSAELPVRAYFALVLDPAAGTITEWVRQEPFGMFTIVSGEAGTFAVADGNRLAGDLAVVIDLQTGQVDESTRRSFVWLATLAGDVLKLRLDGDSPPGEQRAENVVTYRRFTCP